MTSAMEPGRSIWQLSLRDSYWMGIALATAGALVMSFSGIVIRFLDNATSPQIMFFRSLGLLAGLCVLFLIRNGATAAQSLRASASGALAAGPFQGLASIFFILALVHTTIANAMLIMSATPVIASAIGWLVLRERLSRVTYFAMGGASVAIALMTFDGFRSGTGLGALFAICNALFFALYIVMLRRGSRGRRLDMLPAVMVGAIVAGTTGAIVAPSLSVSMHDLLICLAWGGLVQTVGVVLITTSARMIPAAELSLLILLESIGGPIWAWQLLGERMGPLTAAGGALMILVLLTWSLIRVTQERRSRLEAAAPFV